MGPEAFRPALYAWMVFFTTPCCSFGLGRLVLHWYLKDVCMLSYFWLFWHHPFNQCLKQHSVEEFTSVFFMWTIFFNNLKTLSCFIQNCRHFCFSNFQAFCLELLYRWLGLSQASAAPVDRVRWPYYCRPYLIGLLTPVGGRWKVPNLLLLLKGAHWCREFCGLYSIWY
jgi:hypothetical protein